MAAPRRAFPKDAISVVTWETQMALRVSDYAPLLRNTAVEERLAVELTKLPEQERFEFVTKLVDTPRCFAAAMCLARRCLKERRSFEALLALGLLRGDASTVRYWIEAVIEALGFRRTIRLVSERIATDPESVIKAEYHLRKWLPKNNSKAAAEFARLQLAVEHLVRDDPAIEGRVRPFKHLLKRPISHP